MRLPHLIHHHRSSPVQPSSPQQPAPAPAAVPRGGDQFSSSAVSGPVLPSRDDVAVSQAAAVSGGVKSPYAMGRIHADGRQMVGENGEAFTWRGVSEFM